MAEIIAVNQVYSTTVVCRSGAQVSLNRRYWQATSVLANPIPRTTQHFADALGTIVAPFFKSAFGPNAEYRGLLVKRVSGLPPFGSEAGSANGAGIGTVVGDDLPKQTAGLISFGSGLAGPTNRGRMYVPFPNEDNNAGGGKPDAAYTLILAQIANAFITPVVLGLPGFETTLDPVLWSPAVGVPTVTTNFLIRGNWATQKRRGDYGRPNVSPI